MVDCHARCGLSLMTLGVDHLRESRKRRVCGRRRENAEWLTIGGVCILHWLLPRIATSPCRQKWGLVTFCHFPLFKNSHCSLA